MNYFVNHLYRDYFGGSLPAWIVWTKRMGQIDYSEHLYEHFIKQWMVK